MSRVVRQSRPDHGAEYAIYTFGILEADQGGIPGMWEKKASHANQSIAVRQAEDLYNTGQYLKVEIKQKYFDSRKNRNVDLTLKTIGQKKNRSYRKAVAIIFAMICGLVAFGVTYFVGYGG